MNSTSAQTLDKTMSIEQLQTLIVNKLPNFTKHVLSKRMSLLDVLSLLVSLANDTLMVVTDMEMDTLEANELCYRISMKINMNHKHIDALFVMVAD